MHKEIRCKIASTNEEITLLNNMNSVVASIPLNVIANICFHSLSRLDASILNLAFT